MGNIVRCLDETVAFLKGRVSALPDVGIVLGTGLGELSNYVEAYERIPYPDVPHFPYSTAPGHKGELLFGNLSGKHVVVMEGRFHYYEGWSVDQIVYPIRVMKRLGVKRIIISNAAGGLNPLFSLGDVMLITDHINMMGINPLIGPNEDDLGSRFPDMSEPYSRRLIAKSEQVALSLGIGVKKGVYIGVTGPNLETAAEYRFFRLIGADAVGMSTIPEVIAAVHCGLEVLGISVITDMCLPDALKPANVEEIIAVANSAAPKLLSVVKNTVAALD